MSQDREVFQMATRNLEKWGFLVRMNFTSRTYGSRNTKPNREWVCHIHGEISNGLEIVTSGATPLDALKDAVKELSLVECIEWDDLTAESLEISTPQAVGLGVDPGLKARL